MKLHTIAPLALCLVAACATPRNSEGTTAETVEAAEIKTLTYQTDIAAPVETVWNTVIGPESYTQWTEAFMPGSTFEGEWRRGEELTFLAPGFGGLRAEVVELKPLEVISLRHIAYVVNGGEEVRIEDEVYETYRFDRTATGTRLVVDQDVDSSADTERMMNQIWPRALARLKELSEAR